MKPFDVSKLAKNSSGKYVYSTAVHLNHSCYPV